MSGIEALLIEAFHEQLRLQVQVVLVSANELHQAITTRNPDRVWIAAQNLLNAAGNIAKALWGQGGRHSHERAALRESLNVPDESPLTQLAMRNHFEHFDERLDRWWKESRSHTYIDRNVGNRSLIGQWDPLDVFRTFDPQTGILTFWGDSFDLKALLVAIWRLGDALPEGRPSGVLRNQWFAPN